MRVAIELTVPFKFKPGFMTRAFDNNSRQALVRSLDRGVSIAQEETPEGATGTLRNTVESQIVDFAGTSAEFAGDIVWPQPYGAFVNFGTSPHTPPIGPLIAWARKVLGDASAAWAVQKAIAKRGTPSPNHPKPGKGMDIRTRDRLDQEVGGIYLRAVRNFISEIGG